MGTKSEGNRFFSNSGRLLEVSESKLLGICYSDMTHFSLYNHIKPASELRQGSDYSLFKKGIKPMWEDEANRRGGRWLLSLERKQRTNELDRYWLDIVS